LKSSNAILDSAEISGSSVIHRPRAKISLAVKFPRCCFCRCFKEKRKQNWKL